MADADCDWFPLETALSIPYAEYFAIAFSRHRALWRAVANGHGAWNELNTAAFAFTKANAWTMAC